MPLGGLQIRRVSDTGWARQTDLLLKERWEGPVAPPATRGGAANPASATPHGIHLPGRVEGLHLCIQRGGNSWRYWVNGEEAF